MDYSKTFHDEMDFKRETFEARMEKFGFKNIVRMELFLWDLELFLHIQKKFGDRIVLKGGAATQFYLPIVAQRTSVDIDMIFYGTKEEIEEALKEIGEKLGEGNPLFIFREYIPKNPKTELPLHTYMVDVPSVLSNSERQKFDSDIQSQELKIEFIMSDKKREFTQKSGKDIFAVKSNYEYQVLPLESLFADKLTTLGNSTIGIQDDRMDEQVKQFYDILMLIKCCVSDMDFSQVAERYKARAMEEWSARRNGDYKFDDIIVDVRKHLKRYSMADSGEDLELRKYINDFKSLYLNSEISYSPKDVACGASLISLMYELMLEEKSWDMVHTALDIEKKVEFEPLSGKERGQTIRQTREWLINEFGSYSDIMPNILKGKDVKRVFWSVVDIDNISDIEKYINK